MRTHLYQWQVLIASAFLLVLVPQVGTRRAAKAAPDPAVPALTAQGPQGQSIEQSRIKEGLPPGPNMEDRDRTERAKKLAIFKSKFEESKLNVDALADLAQSLKSDLDKGKENVDPLLVAKKTEQIEKLAKKIKKWGTLY